jgi:hypothetical protein
MKQRSEKRMPEPTFTSTLRSRDFEAGSSTPAIVKAIAEVGRQRNELLAKLREALQSGNTLLALDLARELCGLNHAEERHRTNSRIN